MDRIISLIEEAAAWLRKKETDQWNRPWPSPAGRDSRILAHLWAGRTWITWDAGAPAATITADPDVDPHWPEPEVHEPAVYIHRLVVSRSYAGLQLGAQLLDWAARAARRDPAVRWIRISAWTDNERLHEYYKHLGFSRCERGIDDGYPSSALFQRPARYAAVYGPPLFSEK